LEIDQHTAENINWYCKY